MSKLEALSEQLHAIYQAEARRQAELGIDEIRHPDDYSSLPEHTKDYDRVLARFILDRDEVAELELSQARDELIALRRAGKDFLDASVAASKPMNKDETIRVMRRWQAAGHELRKLTGSVVLLES